MFARRCCASQKSQVEKCAAEFAQEIYSVRLQLIGNLKSTVSAGYSAERVWYDAGAPPPRPSGECVGH